MRSFAVVAAAAAASAEASWRSPSVGGDPSSGWLTYAVYKAPSESVITNVSMSWNVPSGQASGSGSGAPGWWYGVQTAAGDGALVQPIVACDYQGSSCEDGTYVLWGGVFDWTKPAQGMHNSALVDSKGGDEVYSYTSCNTKSCTMFVRNERTKKTASLTYELPTSKGTESVLYIVLEHAPSRCSAYPSGGSTTFKHITVEVDGSPVTPDFTAVKGGSAKCGSKTTVEDPQTVSITWETTSESYDLNEPAALKQVAADVNAAKAGWTADAEQTRFATLAHAQSLCGTWTPGHPKYVSAGLPKYSPKTTDAVPAEFDARTQWSNCSVMKKVRNQAGCGSCWAFGATESFEGRRCIATGKDAEYSAGQTSSCSGWGGGNGCGGGQPDSAARWFVSHGVVTGGEYGEDNGCVPYECAPCPKGLYPPDCETNECGNTLKCEKECTNSDYKVPFASDNAKAQNSFSTSGVAAAQKALMEAGPLAATFTVYADFPTYKSGVYKHTSGKQLGGHAVVLMGWGTENGQDYWLLKNSWTSKWGDGGFFKIVRGTNDCGIESDFSGTTF